MKHILIWCCVERIDGLCFNKSSLVSITIPASAVVISEKAFTMCSKLEKVRFEKNSQLTEIRQFVFSSCPLIKKINFPKSLKRIVAFSFYEIKFLETGVIPEDSHSKKIISLSSIRVLKSCFFLHQSEISPKLLFNERTRVNLCQ